MDATTDARPILFSGPMVRALIESRKTQTRRVLKPQPPEWATFCQQPEMFNAEHRWVPSGLWRWSEPEQFPPRTLQQWPLDANGEHYWLRPPFTVGERRWVKETWRTSVCVDGKKPTELEVPGGGYGWPVWYEADGGAVTWRGSKDGGPGFVNPGKLRPSIFMPRWASRLTLIVESIKIERLQDISEDDAEAEGCQFDLWDQALAVRDYSSPDGWFCCWPLLEGEPGYVPVERIWRESYRTLWNSIHGPKAWDANPWVTAVTFRVVAQNIDRIAQTSALAAASLEGAQP